MVVIVNISHGTIISDQAHIELAPGSRVRIAGTVEDILGTYPDLILFMQRGRINVFEESEKVSEHADA